MSTEIKDLGEVFKEAYASLNTSQKDAVDTIEGPVMVIAGPGTGKTQILTLRIANILLQTDTSPESILALTFTDSGAKAMRERLRKYIGSRAYQVPIYTFHSFAQKLIKDYPDAYERIVGGRPASDIEKITIIETIIDSCGAKLLRPSGNPRYYVNHIRNIFSKMKQEYITPNDFAKIISKQEDELKNIQQIHDKGAHKGKIRGEYSNKEKVIVKNQELINIYRQYESVLIDKKLYDFEDMIIQTVKTLSNSKNENMLRDLQEQYQYVLADEHQDVNGSQNKILEILCSYHDSPNIFVVGDEKQAIFRFQGASLENFLYFGDMFKGTKTISLTKNYRSGQMILDASHSLIGVEQGPLKNLRIPLSSELVSNSQVTQRCFSHQAVEDGWLVSKIKNEIKKGVAPDEIAIIVKTNREVESFALLLRKEGIAVTASADGDILKHPITHTIQVLMKAVIFDQDESALFALLHGAYWSISINDLIKITSARNYKCTLIEILCDKHKLKELGLDDIDAAHRVYTVLQEARKREVHEAPHRVLEFLLQESGFLNHVMSEDMFEGARVVRRLYDEIEEMVLCDGIGTLQEVSNMLTTRIEYNLPLNAPYISADPNSVQVMTAHKSKGLEFNTVFIPHLYDRLWGGISRRVYFDIPLTQYVNESDMDATDDERRLLYVAMTRAKTKLHLSCSDKNVDGKELIPTRLFDDMDSQFLIPKETTKEESNFIPVASLTKKNKSIEIDSVLLISMLKNRGLSATSLNNYLRNPWDYFYRNVLRIPETQEMYMQFGTAVHNVLEKSTKHNTQKKKFPSDTAIKSMLENELNKLPITKEEYVRLLEKGLEVLYPYLDYIKVKLPKVTQEEFNIRVVLQTGISELPELTLTGKLDRLDIDENGIVYQVVDYKTGKAKTRNVIEGNTKNSDGGYKRQLVFYALLLSLYDNDRYRCDTGVLSFVEPDAKGMIHEEVFTITSQEIDSLKIEIISTVKEIISGTFLQSACDEGDYCHLVELLKKHT